jgi:hypothetical protein
MARDVCFYPNPIHAFGASVQSYCPDVPYDYSEQLKGYLTEIGVTNKQIRLRTLLLQTIKLDCLVVLVTPWEDEVHAQALEVVDKGGMYSQARLSYETIHTSKTRQSIP